MNLTQMLVMLVPIPFYVRLALYYAFEHPEMKKRNAAASVIGLQQKYSYRMVQVGRALRERFEHSNN